MEELTGTVSVYNYYKKTGALEQVQTISGIPVDYMGPIGSADIHVSPDGKFLYCSNRGESHNIGIFSIDKKTIETGELNTGVYNIKIEDSNGFSLNQMISIIR